MTHIINDSNRNVNKKISCSYIVHSGSGFEFPPAKFLEIGKKEIEFTHHASVMTKLKDLIRLSSRVI
jgi:hypothetical protein